MTKPASLLIVCLSMAVFGCSPRPSAVVHGSGSTIARPPQEASSAERPGVFDPKALLRDLAANPLLRLTTGGDSASARFHFLSRAVTLAPDGAERMANVMVIRDETRVAMLCTSAKGLLYCYATRGFFVALDPARAGGLIVFQGGSPSFTLSVVPETNQLVYQFSYFGRQPDPSISLDLPALLRGLQEKLRSATFDQEQRTIEARTDNAVILITLAGLPPPEHLFPVTDYLMESHRTHNAMMIVGIATDSAPPFDMDAITEASVRKLGLPVRNLTADDVRTIDLMVPVDFGKNPAERRAAERLRELVNPALPAPRNTTRVEIDNRRTRTPFAGTQYERF